MVIQSTKQENSIYDKMKSRVFELYVMERQSAYEAYADDNEVTQALGMIEDNYSLNLYKLDELASLSKMDEVLRRRFIQQKFYIEQTDISEKEKIEAILTSACILKNFGIGLADRTITEEDFYLIARALVNVEPVSYPYYENLILGHLDRLLKMLRNVDGLTINHVKQDKQYVKTENN